MEEVTRVKLDDWEAARGNRVEGAETHYFTVGNVNYSIDLTDPSFAEFQRILAPFLEVATRVPRKAPQDGGRRTGRRSGRNENTQLIREWARANGHTVNSRGRIAESVREAWEQATGVTPESE